LASDYRKSNGQFVVTPAMGPAFVEALPIAKFHGVGPVTAEKMNRLGIYTGADLRRQSVAFLQQHFGKAGGWCHAIAHGEDDRPVVVDRPRKSSGPETSFPADRTDPANIEAGIEAMAGEVWAWCNKAQSFGQTVTVKIKYADFRQVTRSRTLQNPITSKATLRDVSLELVRTVFPVTIGVRLVGVALSNFQNGGQAATMQLDLGLSGAAV
jgi:DNA polymerase-4